jgi:ketosteroid isomerase-like protein
VRRVFEAASRRDRATVLALDDHDVELDFPHVDIATLLGLEICEGHDGLRAMLGTWHQAWENVRSDSDELIDAGEHPITGVTGHTRGRASAVELEWPAALVWTVRDGKVVRVVWFGSLGEAPAAAGSSG